MRTIKFKTFDDAIGKLQDMFPDHVISTWSPEDFDQTAKDMGKRKPLTKEEHIAVAECVNKNHDCNTGINWEFIGYCIDEVKGR